MNQFIEYPNLPSSDIKLALAGKMSNDLYKAFLDLNINIVTLKNCDKLQSPVKSHADMLCHHLGNNSILITNDNQNLINNTVLNTLVLDVNIISENLRENYPNDIKLNVARIGNKLICNYKYIAREIKNYCTNQNIKIIDVPQGYSKCSTLIVNNNAIITEDESICLACNKNHIDVLKIEKGHVNLSGYNYGFIGGCSSLISNDILAFFGNIKSHPNFNSIKSFLSNYNINPISLTNSKLIDIGGIIPILEQCK